MLHIFLTIHKTSNLNKNHQEHQTCHDAHRSEDQGDRRIVLYILNEGSKDQLILKKYMLIMRGNTLCTWTQ